MKIDWKTLAKSPGYRSLKAAYERDAQKAGKYDSPLRKKAELYRHFQWVINRAKHYAERKNQSIEQVLNTWERGRTYWWLSYYQDGNMPKLPSGKPRNVKPMGDVTYLSLKRHGGDKKRAFKNLRHARQRRAHWLRKNAGKKPRWSAERKRQEALMRKYRKENL